MDGLGRVASEKTCVVHFLSVMQKSRQTSNFKSVLTLQYQEMEHNSAPSTCSQTPVALLAPCWAYSPFPVHIPGQCIPGTMAHRESLRNTRTRDICIGSDILHPGPWIVRRCKDGQSICTDLWEIINI